ncbi:MAG: AAA family ATPase [Waddliaceae bacterium]|nr:AAA family ATPase [Waddliaceae bacterium]
MHSPLSEKLRPRSLGQILGQDHLIGPKGFLTNLVTQGRPLSILLWGPPGSGKTSIARLYAQAFGAKFVNFSAVFGGISDLRKIIKEAEEQPLFNSCTILFVDEIHRFNKAQQDGFLPHLEKGTFILVGATTENPSFSLNNALLSRLRVLTLHSLDTSALSQLIDRYEKEVKDLNLSEEARQFLIHHAQGDGRYLCNLIENIEAFSSKDKIEISEIEDLLQKKSTLFDRSGDSHYNLISALHKSIRGSDPDAALYWFCRILEGGEDPLFLARRLIRMASEDIGLADPNALNLCISARDAFQMLGSPEGELSLAEAVVYLALAPKSNAVYLAYKKAQACAQENGQASPPSTILNAPTRLMKEMGYGKGYQYDHDCLHAFSGQNYFPDNIPRQSFYHPVERGFEREMRKRLDYFQHLRELKN